LAQIGSNVNHYNVSLYYGSQIENLNDIISYNDLIYKIRTLPKWMKVLKYIGFRLYTENSFVEITNDTTLKAAVSMETSTTKLKIVLKLDSQSFSAWKESHEEALSLIGLHCNRLEFIRRDDSCFPKLSWSQNVTEIDFNAVLLCVTEDIVFRNEVFDQESAPDNNTLEFISPILIGVLRLLKAFLKSSNIDMRLSLLSKKFIIGQHAYGSVDFVMVFEHLEVMITKTKRYEMLKGIVQNLIQQRASQEFFTKCLNIEEQNKNEEPSRKRPLQEAFGNHIISETCGCVTSGNDWVFTKLQYNNVTKQSNVSISETYSINWKSSKEVLQDTIRPILSKYVRMVIDYIEIDVRNMYRKQSLDAFEVYKKQAKDGIEVEREIMESQSNENEEGGSISEGDDTQSGDENIKFW